MLNNAAWVKYAPSIMVEWKQCLMEGREVEQYKDLCEEIQRNSYKLDYENVARELGKIMTNSNIRPDFDFIEPSCLDEIKNLRPTKRHHTAFNLSDDLLFDKIKGAWIGRVAGCLLGKPVEGWRTSSLYPLLKATNNYPMHKYIKLSDFSEDIISSYKINTNNCWADNINGSAPVDDDTNYTVFSLKLLEKYGKNFTPLDVINSWLDWFPMYCLCTAERVAYKNAAGGMLPPETATYFNPFREYIGAQIRGDFFGYINPGNPQLAAEMAWRDASISHVKNGIYGEMFISAMIATACITNNIMTVIEAGLDEIPEKCRLRKDIDTVISWYKQEFTASDIIAKIQSTFDENLDYDWCYTNSNAMIVVMALLCGEKDFGKSICLAVQAGFDTDCNGATVGSVIGIMNGAKNIDTAWTSTFNNKLNTSVFGYNFVDIENLTENTIKIIKLL